MLQKCCRNAAVKLNGNTFNRPFNLKKYLFKLLLNVLCVWAIEAQYDQCTKDGHNYKTSLY